MKSKFEVKESNNFVRLSSKAIHLNYINGRNDNKNGGLAIEFQTDGLKNAVFTMSYQQLCDQLFANAEQPLEQRKFHITTDRSKDEAQLQFPNARVFLSYPEALEFVDAVDRLYQVFKNTGRL